MTIYNQVTIIRQQELGVDRVDDQGHVGVPPPVGTTDHGADSEMRRGQRVGVPLGSVGS